MAKLLYVLNVSLDGYIADEDGNLDWRVPGEEYFSFVNDLERPVGTYLYGRRLYELMAVWETDPAAAAQSPGAREFAEIWQSADKVVYSRTLATASTTYQATFAHTAVGNQGLAQLASTRRVSAPRP
jgi:dihydrofolate reductase